MYISIVGQAHSWCTNFIESYVLRYIFFDSEVLGSDGIIFNPNFLTNLKSKMAYSVNPSFFIFKFNFSL